MTLCPRNVFLKLNWWYRINQLNLMFTLSLSCRGVTWLIRRIQETIISALYPFSGAVREAGATCSGPRAGASSPSPGWCNPWPCMPPCYRSPTNNTFGIMTTTYSIRCIRNRIWRSQWWGLPLLPLLSVVPLRQPSYQPPWGHHNTSYTSNDLKLGTPLVKHIKLLQTIW